MRNNRRAFNTMELVMAGMIVAMLAAAMIPFVANYVDEAKLQRDKQTLEVLNDAINQYKQWGGDLTALTAGADPQNVLDKLAEPITSYGMTQQFINDANSFDPNLIMGDGNGKQYAFVRYDRYFPGLEAKRDEINAAIATEGLTVSDQASFNSWLENAIRTTNSLNYIVFKNSTENFRINAGTKNASDVVKVWWDDGTDNDTYTLNQETWGDAIQKTYDSATDRGIVLVGDLSLLVGNYGDASWWAADIGTMKTFEKIEIPNITYARGDVSNMSKMKVLTLNSADTMTGDISGMKDLESLYLSGSNTVTGDISDKTKIYYMGLWGNSTVYGDISNLTLMEEMKVAGNSSLTGDLSGLVNMRIYQAAANSYFTGDISGLTSLESLNQQVSGDLYGDLSNLVNLTYISMEGGSVTGLAQAAANAPGLRDIYWNANAPALSETEMNAIMTSLWAKYQTYGLIGAVNTHFNYGSADPTGQGLADANSLISAGWAIWY